MCFTVYKYTITISHEGQGDSLVFSKNVSGRQRFRVKQIQRPSDAILRANVEILGDPVPDRIYYPNGKMRDFVRKGPHPVWMYKLHDVYHIMQLIKNVVSPKTQVLQKLAHLTKQTKILSLFCKRLFVG